MAESAGSMLTSDYTFSVKEACMEKLLRIYDYFYAAEERDQWAAELDHIKSTGDRIMVKRWVHAVLAKIIHCSPCTIGEC